MTMYAHGYELVQKPAFDLTQVQGLRWMKRVAWLRLGALAFSIAAWALVIVAARILVN